MGVSWARLHDWWSMVKKGFVADQWQVADDDDQSVREVVQVPAVVALCPRNSVGRDLATSSVETSPDRWRPMIRCQAMESRQISVKGSRLGRVG